MTVESDTHPEGTMQEKIRTGCMGWSYIDWVGPFYPKGASGRDFLRLYSSVFDAVEVNSSFYRIPETDTALRWREVTPEGFIFTLKFPMEIVGAGKTGMHTAEVEQFENSALSLGRKLAAVLILLPPSETYSKMFDWIRDFTAGLGNGIRYAMEFRNSSWFREEVYDLLRRRDICFAWSSNQYLETPPEITGDILYVRLIGDRSLTKFDKIQIDRAAVMKNWVAEVTRAIGDNKVSEALVFSNNHFAGFAPQTINTFRKMAGMAERNWLDLMSRKGNIRAGHSHQTRLDSVPGHTG